MFCSVGIVQDPMGEQGVSHQAILLGPIVMECPLYVFYEVAGESDRWAKSIVETRVKRYPLGITIRYPGRMYARLKYGIRDLAEHEFDQWQAMPETLRPYLLKNVTLEWSQSGKRLLCSERVRDYDGSFSKTLSQTGGISNPHFWEHVSGICEALRSSRLYFLGVFHGGSQILVHKLSRDHWRPLILDVTKLGRKMYPFQLDLWRERSLERKFERQLVRFVERFLI